MRVNGTLVTSGSASQSISLSVGSNTITVVGTAEDGTTTSTYTVVVTRISNVANLSSLALSGGTLSPAFAANTPNYTASVPNATSSITVTPSTTNAFATVRVNGTLVSSGVESQSIPLNVGSNTITVITTAQDGTTTSTYTVAVTRFSSVATLSALTLSSGTLSPSFETNTTTYSAIVANPIGSITVRPTLTATTATVKVNGTLVTSGTPSQSIPLSLGSNTISIIGTAQDDTITSTYTLTVWKYQCTLVDAGIAEGGSASISWNAVDVATLTATPNSGYLFGAWTGDASGSDNPAAVVMDSDKTVGATFVEDTRDPDSDGLTNYQEIIVRLTNPNVADSDSDGVNDGQEVIDTTNPLVADTDDDGLSDGEEKTRNTNPLAKDTDGDGLSDLEEELNTKTNPLLADTDGDSISDALEDTDNDGISNLREVTELKTDPLLVDTDADGLSDTYELIYKGSVAAFAPRIGDRLRFELRELVPQGTLKLVGALPTGLFFNAVTGVLEGKLTGKPGLVKLSIQVLNGKTVLRTIPLQFTVLAFPSGLIGTWQVLLEDANGSPQGMITTLISSPGVWSAQYDSLGTKTLRSSKGVFDLTPSMDRAAIAITFPVVSLTPAFSSSWQIDATTALAAGSYAQGTLRGFRLAKTGELPTASRQITMVIDQGEQDGYQIPAGLGWATGTLGTTGSLPLSGQLGDAQSLKTTVRLSATGQAMMWVKPYRNLNSLIGGIISLRDTGIVPQSPYTSIRNGLSWRRVADNAELSYSSGFGPLAADASVNLHNKPTSSLVFSANLGLSNSEFRNVVFDGGGLPSAEQFTAMPERFVMDSTYKLNPVALPGRVMALWQGVINSTAGSFTGTIALDASNSGILKGNASV
ncbi:MAG: hypothetical protein CAK88_09720, partial [Verrucomicrobiia bacterium AMD-G2]